MCQQHAALQQDAAGRGGGLNNVSQLSLRIEGELGDAADRSKYAGRSPFGGATTQVSELLREPKALKQDKTK